MPYKDPEQAKENARKRTERARLRRQIDPEFARKEKEARKKWYETRYKPNAEYKRYKNAKRVVGRYGLTLDDYRKLLEQQDGKCLICGIEHRDEPRSRLVIDHDHDKGATHVRGLLCGLCNIGIGAFRDSPEYLRAAADYLERRNESS